MDLSYKYNSSRSTWKMVLSDKKDKMDEKPLPPMPDNGPIDEQLKIYDSESIAKLVPTRKEVLWRKYHKAEEELWSKIRDAAESGASMISHERLSKPEIIDELTELLTEYMGYECSVDLKTKDRVTISWKSKLTDDRLSKKERTGHK